MTPYKYYETCCSLLKEKIDEYTLTANKTPNTPEERLECLMNLGRALGLQEAREVMVDVMSSYFSEKLVELKDQENTKEIILPENSKFLNFFLKILKRLK